MFLCFHVYNYMKAQKYVCFHVISPLILVPPFTLPPLLHNGIDSTIYDNGKGSIVASVCHCI